MKTLVRCVRLSRSRLWSSLAAVVAVFAFGVLTPSAARGGVVFVDGFEGSAIDPFWSTSVSNGAISLTSAKAHSGSQSAQFSSFNASSTKYEVLEHVFATPTYGETSVWIYDTGAGVDSSNYIIFDVRNDALNFNALLLTYDYGFAGGGPGRGDQYNYAVNPPGVPAASGIDRTAAWHQFKIVDTPDTLALLVDGVTVYSQTGGTPFNAVRLLSQAPDFRPAFTQYYDDFSIETLDTAVPEPSSIVLLGLGSVLGLLHYVRKRYRSPALLCERNRGRSNPLK